MSNWSRILEGTNIITGSLILSGSADIRGLGRITERVTALTVTGNTLTIPLSSGSVFSVVSGENINTITINDVPPAGACGFTLVIQNTVPTPPFTYAVTWAPITWPGGVAPNVGGTTAARDIVSVFTPNGGTNWYGFEGGLNFQ